MGRDLPTEAQREYAARGRHYDGEDWSQAYDKDSKPIANTWQGILPVYNTEEDGYAGTAPVRILLMCTKMSSTFGISSLLMKP